MDRTATQRSILASHTSRDTFDLAMDINVVGAASESTSGRILRPYTSYMPIGLGQGC